MTTEHANMLSLYGLNADSHAIGLFTNPDGTKGFFYAPAENCFRCLGVCPGYWSLDYLANYGLRNGLIRPGATVTYTMHDTGKVGLEVKVYNSPRIVAV